MPPIDKHIPGSFCWFELATTDQSAAKRFYQALFGWDVQDSPIGPDEFYSSFKLQGRDVAAAYTLRAEQRAAGVPPNWMAYVSVDNADAMARRAAELGGTLLAPPFDVMDFGRMSVIREPTGAVFAIWQSKTHIGTGIRNEDGTAVWADLSTPDQARGGKYYADLFGWKMVEGKSELPAKPGQYYHIMNAGEFIGGVPPSEHRDPKMPAHWLIYFSVADCRAAVDKAKLLGAQLIYGPIDMEGVRTFAVLVDPQGAAFAIVDYKH
jgi:predicted enzyme related to lactoylglutathione lyase